MFANTLIRARTLWGLAPVFRTMWRGYRHRSLHFNVNGSALRVPDQTGSLLKYFSEHKEGRGIFKFNHYFEGYERHFARFRGQNVHVLEIGIYSGGSLEMWKNFFGPASRIYGVDIDPRCKAYESDSVRVFIGDQGDRDFWRRFKEEVPVLDIVIDDGGHVAGQQIVSLEELLPHLRPGGIYVCEDLHEAFNGLAAYVCGLAQDLNSSRLEYNWEDNERYSVSKANSLQSAIAGIHFYPYMAVIEKTRAPVVELVAPKRGSQWLPGIC
jgi:Methyltransferase domain